VEQLAFSAREDKRVDKRSGVSQRLPISVTENVVSNAERRALRNREELAVPRVVDIYAALPAMTGKIELEYEGELKGGDAVGRELIRGAVGKVFDRYFEGVNMQPIVQWFDIGGSLKLGADAASGEMARELNSIQGLMEKTRALGLGSNEPDEVRASAGEFVLEGLHAHRRISRSEERGFAAEERKRGPAEPEDSPRARQRRQFN
jgi:magnesium chelatase subunit I